MAKNIINEIPYGNSRGSAQTIFGAPADGSRTNTLSVIDGVGYAIPNNTSGYGLRYDTCNGAEADLSENLNIPDDNGDIIAVIRRRYSNQRDKEYLDIYNDYLYQNGCVKIFVKKTCWLLIEGTAVTTGPGGSPTQSTGIGIWRHNGLNWITPAIAAGSYTNEPGTDGLALPVNSLQYYAAGTVIKIGVVTTHEIHLMRTHMDSGTMSLESYINVTRISDTSTGGGGSGSSTVSTLSGITLGPIGTTSNANGATLVSRVLNLEPASESFGGVVNTVGQTFAGDKEFTGDIIVQKTVTLPQTTDAGTGVIYFGGGTRIHDYSAYETVKNLFIGYDAGNFTGPHSYNIALGTETGSSLTSGNSNFLAGHGTSSLTSGNYNTLISGGAQITTGSRNLCIGGQTPGLNYTDGNESDNVCISNMGVTGDQKKIRIGTGATHDACYIAGITGVAVGGSPVYVGADGQLGVGAQSVTSLAPIGSAPNANGATLVGSVLNLEPASVDFGGIVNTGAQSFNGTKTFTGVVSPTISTGFANVTSLLVGNTGTNPDISIDDIYKNRKLVLYKFAADDNQSLVRINC